MSLELLALFVGAMLAAILGHVGFFAASPANVVSGVCLAVFVLAARFQGVRKPVI